MSVQKMKNISDVIRSHACDLEQKGKSFLEKAEATPEISQKIELYTAAEIANATACSLYACIGEIMSGTSSAQISAEDMVRTYISDLEKRRSRLLKQASDNVKTSKKIDLYKTAESVNKAIHVLQTCVGLATQENGGVNHE